MNFLICSLMRPGYLPPTPSTMTTCHKCKSPVWRSDSSPSDTTPICMACFVETAIAAEPTEKIVIELPTSAQQRDMRAHELN